VKKFILAIIVAVFGLGFAAIPLVAALGSSQVIQFNPGSSRSLADGTFSVVARSCETTAPYACGAADQGIDHAFTSLTPATCSVAETVSPYSNLSTADITPLATGTCAIRVTASGPGVGTNPGALATQRFINIVP
jgi:hypothetical protein